MSDIAIEKVEALATEAKIQDSPLCTPAQISVDKKPATVLEKLCKLSINGKVEDMRKQAKNATYVAGRMALAGQITVFYAGPNTGKTLITLKLISEAIANGTAGQNVYHINLDDNFDGLIGKADLGNRYGFNVLTPDVFVKPNHNFSEIVDALIKEGSAGEAVFILDTIKKFVDPMDKKASSQFMTNCRRLTSAGGTIIALAHVNKKTDDAEQSIPAGTSDILDDCDCAYVIDVLNEDSTKRTVEFQQKKSRGPVVQSAVYSYELYDGADYQCIFNSVKLIDGNEADRARAAKALSAEKLQDADLTKAITSILNTSSAVSQKDILANTIGSGTFSRRKVLDCLKRWSCAAEEGGIWSVTKGENNSNCYLLNK